MLVVSQKKFARTLLKASSEEVIVMRAFLENEGKVHEGGFVKELGINLFTDNFQGF